MQDLQTESLWSQVSGKAIMGPRKGRELTLYPSSMTTYGEFKKLYPNGKLLSKPERFGKGSRYEEYFSDSAKLGIFGRADNFRRVPGKTKVIGLRLPFSDVAVTTEKLADEKVVLIPDAQPPVVIAYDGATETAFAYQLTGFPEAQRADISLEGTALSIGDTTFDLRTGQPAEDNVAALKPIPIITAFWFAWASFFPTTDLIH